MDELISRQAVMNCFKKWQPYMATRLWYFEQELSAIPSIKLQPCEDAISRQAVLEELPRRTMRNYFGEVVTEVVDVDDIKALPPVKPQPKTGHWIRVAKDKLRCSECDVIHFIGQYPQGKIAWCPNCGAKMQAESED